APDARAVPPCIEELKRGEHEPDLRAPAIAALLESGEGAHLRDLYAGLPPDAAEPEVFHRFLVTKRAYSFASPGQSSRMREQVIALEPALRGALESEHEIERIYAAAALLTLGDDSMEAYLLKEFERDGEAAGWDAIRLLAIHNGSAKARAICLKELDAGERRVGFYTALDLLGKIWISDPEVRRRLEGFLHDSTWLEDGRLLQRLIRVDRPLILEFLREQIQSGDPRRVDAAVEFVKHDSVREAVPWLMELLHKSTGDRKRLYFLRALVALRAPDALPMLRAELVEAEDSDTRGLALGAILGTGDPEGLEEVAGLVREGERLVLDALQARALSRGRDGVPDELLSAVLAAVRELPSEESRIQALWILRGRGILDPVVEDGLTQAYRTEPSQRVAREISRALEELAHR
ncbi:MAG: HEAT repeat domain-containing protein, partial [Planctomycetota bacterium]